MPQVHIDRILLATDFSPGSMAALPYAVALARRFHSKLYLAHVLPPEAYSMVPMSERDAALETVKAHANAQMAGLRAMTVLEGIAHKVLIDHGDVWPILSAMAEKEAIDLLVIGSHGRRGIEKLLLGSTAEEILRLAQRPVLMVGPQCSVAPETELSLHRILHATDFSSEAEPALHYAFSLAKAYGATLALLHVAEDVWREPLTTRLRPADFFRERFLEKHWAPEEGGVVPEYYVEFGARADCILEVSDKLRSELIVIGVRGARYPLVAAHLPGPTAYDVVARARCPVLVLRGAQSDSN